MEASGGDNERAVSLPLVGPPPVVQLPGLATESVHGLLHLIHNELFDDAQVTLRDQINEVPIVPVFSSSRKSPDVGACRGYCLFTVIGIITVGNKAIIDTLTYPSIGE